MKNVRRRRITQGEQEVREDLLVGNRNLHSLDTRSQRFY